jgi:LysM repeat protein
VPVSVQTGDTLMLLAMRSLTTMAALRIANCLADTIIQPGQTIYVPAQPLPTPTVSPQCFPPYGWVFYVVRPGDTMFSIAARYGLTLSQLMFANCRSIYTVYVGETLYVPWVSPTATEVPTATPIPPTDTPVPPPDPTRTPRPPTPTATNTPPPASGTPTPTGTPVPPTPTGTSVPPTPTDTPVPPTPTGTSVPPTPTDTPAPPTPTDTPVPPTPTDTPAPPTPTDTPAPPTPTDTPIAPTPTDTPAPPTP